MDEGKILVVNLSKGLIGEDNASILGAFLVTKIQLAAMSRSDIPNIADRRPFYLYVDEFQNFATDSFATILSEARKYALNLTVANQYIAQMSDEVRTAVFGNVGSMISFRVSADDAPLLVKQFEPQFEVNDLVNMHNRNFIMSMIIDGEKQPAFSASTLNLPEIQTSFIEQIIDHSRRNYGRNRVEVEQEIASVIRIPEQFDTPSRQRFQEKVNQKKSDSIDLRKIRPSQHENSDQNSDKDGYQRLNPQTLSEIKNLLNTPSQKTEPEELKNTDQKASTVKKRRRPRNTKKSAWLFYILDY